MSGYRIEVSPNNRAGCQDTVCKANGVKIIKGSLRFGTWVNIMDHGGWRWKHWGCVSGNQLESVRNSAATGDGYDWDTIDGYDEMGDHPDLQEKVRTAIEEGHIAAEDFNGDPEYNVLGQRAIRSRAAVKAGKEGEDPAAVEDKGTTPKKTPAKGTKRGRKSTAADDSDEEEADETPSTKRAKKATPAKSEPATTPRPRGRPRKSAAKAEVDSDEADMVHAVPIPAPRGRGRPRKAAAAPKEEASEDEEEEEQPKKKKKKAAAPRGRAKKAREPDSDEEDMVHAVPIPPRGRGRPRKST